MKNIEQHIDETNGQVYSFLENDKGEIKKMYIAYLVANTFKLPNPNNYKYLIHKDGDRLNNSIDNLEWNQYPEDKLYYIS